MTTIFPTTVPSKRLSESITSDASEFTLNSITGWDGNDLTSADFGTVAYAVFRNSAGTLMEIMEIDPTTITSASDAITINRRGLKFTGDLTTEVPANFLTWVKGDTIVELGTHVPQLLKSFVDIYAAQTVEGIKTFSSSPVVPTPSGNTDAANKAYVDGVAVAGAPDANTTTKGIVEEATQAEVDAKTTTGGTGAKLFAPLDKVRSTLLSDYKADTGSANAYVITPSPAITAYTTGQIFSFKATNANTTTSTLNVNGLGVKTIKKLDGATNLASGDIAAGQVVLVEYDGTNFIMLSSTAKSIEYNGSAYPAADGSAITYTRIMESYPRGETVNGATTPVPVVLIDDTFQEEYLTGQNADFGKVTTGNRLAFGFKLQSSITLTTLKVYLRKQGTPADNIVFTIETNSSGAPSGTPVTNGTANSIAGSSLTTSYVLTTVTFGSTVTLAANTQYWLVAKRDSTTSDVNYYQLNGIADGNKYASFTGSTYNATSWSTGAIVPYAQLVCATGSSISVWRCDTDHANYHMRFGVGLVNTDGAVSVSANVIFKGVVTGFTGLTPNALYYAQDTIGTLGTSSGTTECIIGTSISPTALVVGLGADRLQYITSQSLSVSSGAGTANDLGIIIGKYAKMVTGDVTAQNTPSSTTATSQLTIYKTGKTSGVFNDQPNVPSSALQFSLSWSGNNITAAWGGSADGGSGTIYIYR